MSWSERNKILKSEVAAGGNNNQLIQVHPCIHFLSLHTGHLNMKNIRESKISLRT